MRLLDRAIFCSLLALFPITAFAYGNYAQRADGIFESLIFILGSLWIIEAWMSRAWNVSGRSLLYPLLGIVIITLVQISPLFGSAAGVKSGSGLPISADPFETKLFLLKLISLVLVGQLLLQHISSKRRLQILICVIVGVGVASALSGLGHYFVQHSVHLSSATTESSFGQFNNRNHFAFLMEMTFGLILGLMLGGGWWRGKFLIALAAATVVCTALILTYSRGGILSMTVQVFFFSLASLSLTPQVRFIEKVSQLPGQLQRIFNPLVRRAVLIICLLITLPTAVLLVGGNGIAERFSSVPDELEFQDLAHRTNTRRLEIWRATVLLIRANLIAGVGFGAYEAAIPEYYDATGDFRLQQAHNDYLELLGSGGLIAGTMGAWFAIVLIRRARQRFINIGDPFRRAICLGSLTGLLGVAVHSFVDFGLHIFVNALIFTALVVVASTNIGDEKEKKLSRRFHLALSSPLKKIVTYAVAGTCLLICLSGTWAASRVGLSRMLSYQGRASNNLGSVVQAVRLSPNDPEAHYAYAVVLANSGRPAEAVGEFQDAIARRPRDYNLWLELGRAHERSGDYSQAIESSMEAARHAPYYAQPHWQIGELFLKVGQRYEAFKEFSIAARSNPDLFMDQVTLAWKEYAGDAQGVLEAVQPQTSSTRLALACYFAKYGQPDASMRLFRTLANVSEHDRTKLLRELLTAKRFSEAHEVWSGGREDNSRRHAAIAAEINDGSFEDNNVRKDAGFDWVFVRNLKSVAVSLDVHERRSGTYSLRLDFAGNSLPASRIFSQIVLVKPETVYSLDFAARTQDVATEGLPIVKVIDAATNDSRALAQSPPLPLGTSGWQKYTVKFGTVSSTSAVIIAVERQQCESEQCPIFGKVWFDDFSLRDSRKL